MKSRRGTTLFLATLIAIGACSSSPTDTVGSKPLPGFTIAVSTPTLSLAPGSTAIATIRSVRDADFTRGISYAVTGTPVGMSVRIDNVVASDSATLTVSTLNSLAIGKYNLVVHATAANAEPQEAKVEVSVHARTDGMAPVTLVASGAHSCMLTADGTAYCWGYNGLGALGTGDSLADNPVPVAVSGGLHFQTLSLSKQGGVSCGLVVDGRAYCWGVNKFGQLGDGTTEGRLLPSAVAGALSFRSIAVGTAHACAVSTAGDAYCWGFTSNGAFGNAMLGTQVEPRRAAVGLQFKLVVAGGDFTCGLTIDGAAYCWGLGGTGQLGDGKALTSMTPVAVAGGVTFRTLVAGHQSVCGLTVAGVAYCWGYNFYGTIGDGTSGRDGGSTRRVSPVPVVGGLTFASLSAGLSTMCGVTADGTGYCWGYNDLGAVGDGTTTHRSQPVRIAGNLTFQHVAAGTFSSCGLTTDNAVYCWGENFHGGLGIGSTADVVIASPTRVLSPQTK